MRCEPFTEVVSGHFDGAIRFISRVDFGMDDMRVCQRRPQKGVDMVGEGSEGLVIAVKPMDVDDEKRSTLVRF